MASLALASCAGDYDDWANPQANEQEASAAKYGVTFANGSEAEGSMADEDGIINLVTVNSTDANVTGFTLKDLKVNGVAVNGTLVGNSVQVSASELEKIVCEQNKSRASVARDLNVETQVSINLASGDAVSITNKGETTGKFTPTATPQLDKKGYYMLGQVNGHEWDAKSPVWMNKISDGVYQLKVTTTADKNWFKFYAGSKWDEGGDWKIIEAAWGAPKFYLLSHIPGADYIDTNEVESEPLWNKVSDASLQAMLAKHGIRHDTTVILYGRDVYAAARVAQIMLYAGVKDVRLLDGGPSAPPAAG